MMKNLLNLKLENNFLKDYCKNITKLATFFGFSSCRILFYTTKLIQISFIGDRFAKNPYYLPSTTSCSPEETRLPISDMNRIYYENQKMLFETIKNSHVEIQQLKKDMSRLTHLFFEQIYSEDNFVDSYT